MIATKNAFGSNFACTKSTCYRFACMIIRILAYMCNMCHLPSRRLLFAIIPCFLLFCFLRKFTLWNSQLVQVIHILLLPLRSKNYFLKSSQRLRSNDVLCVNRTLADDVYIIPSPKEIKVLLTEPPPFSKKRWFYKYCNFKAYVVKNQCFLRYRRKTISVVRSVMIEKLFL